MIGKLLDQGNDKLRELGLGSYLNSGAETGRVIKITRDYIDSLTIEMRLIDSKPASTRFDFLGSLLETPIMVGALSGLNKICTNPMVEMARGVAGAKSSIWLGIGEEDELKEVVQTGTPTVKIIKPYRDEDLIIEKITQAETSGAIAVGMDIDFFYGGKREDTTIRSNIMGPKSFESIRSYIEATKLPFIIKGVLSVQDAMKSVEAGASAIVVSHHGGAVLDYGVPPLKVLPAINQALEGRIPIIVDSGLNRGTDIFKALALGAQGVLIGRAMMAALAVGGAQGVEKMIKGLNEELIRVMNLTCCSELKDIDSSLIWS